MKNEPTDRLPPFSEKAEQGVLGCLLLEPDQGIAACEEWFGTEVPFFDVRHQTLWLMLAKMRREARAIDAITLHQALIDEGKLQEAGGAAYFSALPDTVPSAANLDFYLEIVWEKFLARQWLQNAGAMATGILDLNGINEVLIERSRELQDRLEKGAQRGEISPQYLKTAADFGEEVYAKMFREEGQENEPGLSVPVLSHLRFKIRRGETTVVSGDNGSGKSTVLNYFALHLAAAGEKVCVVSLEMPVATTIWVLMSQLLGRKFLQDSTPDHERFVRAIAWVNARFLFYDYLGIGDWRDIMRTFRFAATKRGCAAAIVDNAMRMGILEDDYAGQALAASNMMTDAKNYGYHLFIVLHENKGDGKGKSKVAGTKKWTDNPDNWIKIERNEAKGEAIEDARKAIEDARLHPDKDPELAAADLKELEEAWHQEQAAWDTKLVLGKQRYPGSQQNAATRCWFDHDSFQFREHYQDRTTDWLEKWKEKTATPQKDTEEHRL